MSAARVLVAGLPRSGTTWVGEVLGRTAGARYLHEPDNHLDLGGKAYLEQFINSYPGAVVLISHDRYLLDAVVTHIVEIEDGKLSTFAVDYSAYVIDKEQRLARAELLARNCGCGHRASRNSCAGRCGGDDHRQCRRPPRPSRDPA